MENYTSTRSSRGHHGFISLIPNAITLLNALAGVLAIVHVALGDFLFSFYLFSVCLVLDFADGFAARLLKATSELGKQLDSLADMISFGLYPSLAIFFALHGQHSFWGGAIIPGLVLAFPLFAILRLGIFNTESPHPLVFYGLPSPAAAIGVVAIVYMVIFPGSSSIFSLINDYPFVPVMLVLLYSVLMVTRLPMISLKFDRSGWKRNRYRVIFLGLAVVLVLAFQFRALLVLIPAYILYSLAVWPSLSKRGYQE